MAKFTKVGTLQLKKDRSGQTVKLGVYNKNDKFKTSTDIRVKDAEGNVVAGGTDSYLIVQDPRNRPGITPEQASRIPDFILGDLVLVTEE